MERIDLAFFESGQGGADLDFWRPGDGMGEPAEGLPGEFVLAKLFLYFSFMKR